MKLRIEPSSAAETMPSLERKEVYSKKGSRVRWFLAIRMMCVLTEVYWGLHVLSLQ